METDVVNRFEVSLEKWVPPVSAPETAYSECLSFRMWHPDATIAKSLVSPYKASEPIDPTEGVATYSTVHVPSCWGVFPYQGAWYHASTRIQFAHEVVGVIKRFTEMAPEPYRDHASALGLDRPLDFVAKFTRAVVESSHVTPAHRCHVAAMMSHKSSEETVKDKLVKSLMLDAGTIDNQAMQNLLAPEAVASAEALHAALAPEAKPKEEIPALKKACPALESEVTNPVVGGQHKLRKVIANLNDHQGWTREEIADWLDTLDTDTSINLEEAS